MSACECCVSVLKNSKKSERRRRLRKSIWRRRSNFRVSNNLFVNCYLQNIARKLSCNAGHKKLKKKSFNKRFAFLIFIVIRLYIFVTIFKIITF